MARYLAVIHQKGGSAFGLSFPDVPGCVGAGRTLDLALRNAAEALAFHLEGLAEDGGALPRPSGYRKAIAAVLAEDDDEEALVGFHWVEPAKAESDLTVRLNVTLPQSLVNEIDAAAGERGRSGFLALAARERLSGSAVHTVKAAGYKKKGRRNSMRIGAAKRDLDIGPARKGDKRA